MKRPKFAKMGREKKANMIAAFNAGETVGQIAQRTSMSQAAVITILEDGGCENVQPLSLRPFSWEERLGSSAAPASRLTYALGQPVGP